MYFEDAPAAQFGESVSQIFNEQMKKDHNQVLAIASMVGQNPAYNRPPDYFLYIVNISTREFVRHRPPDFPRIPIRACPKGDPYVVAVKVPNIIHYKWPSPETGQPSFDSIRGERWATDLVNPANLGDQMWVEVSNQALKSMHGMSDDLSIRGVFWTKNLVPTAQELKLARTRMEAHYRLLVQQADKMAASPKTIDEIGEEHHLAADYLGINSTWHVRQNTMMPCPNCGDMINDGIAYHMSTVGVVCILDWQRAVKAGIKTKEDVPEEFRWWTVPEPTGVVAEEAAAGEPAEAPVPAQTTAEKPKRRSH